MENSVGLGRRIASSMVAVAVATALVIILGIWLFYFLVFTFAPEILPDPSSDPTPWLPTGKEFVVYALLTMLGATVAILVAVRLANRIVAPLNSVAACARQIAKGELSARAIGGSAPGEAAILVQDFNAMAGRLEVMTESIRTWNAAAAHELRTPLTILRGRLHGLIDGVFAPDRRTFEGLLRQVEDLTRLVEDLRLISLAESGHLSLAPCTVDLAHEANNVLQIAEPDLSAAGLVVKTDFSSVQVHADPARIRQALLALLDNARRYANPGTLLVRARQDAREAVLSVTDTGPGLPPQLAAAAFEPFRRGDDSRSRSSGGSGLGLAVIKAIATAHGGRVLYYQTEWCGSVFELRLPIDQPAREPATGVPIRSEKDQPPVAKTIPESDLE